MNLEQIGGNLELLCYQLWMTQILNLVCNICLMMVNNDKILHIKFKNHSTERKEEDITFLLQQNQCILHPICNALDN